MRGRRALGLLALAGLVLASSQPAARGQGSDPRHRPNIIYIYADDLGIGDLGAYGQSKIRTPHFDRMAREGLRFTQHYSSSPVCAPSRAMLLTGLHGGHSYIRGNYELGGFPDEYEGGQMPLPPQTRTLGHVLRDAGYATAAIGKWGLGMHDTSGDPNQQGFDLFFGYLDQKQAHNYYPTHLWENGARVPLRNPYFSPHQRLTAAPAALSAYDRYRGVDYAPDFIAARAERFITDHRHRPFFLYLAFTIPHAALQAPAEAVQRYAGTFEERPYLGDNGYLPTPYPRSTYAAMVTTLDGYVGRVLDQLRSLGLDDRTLVMFSSDNGASFDVGGVQRAFFNSTAGLRGAKMDVYEGGIRAPFLARWPGHVPAGQTTHLISVQYDLLATLSELVGVSPPPNDGVSFLPTLLGRSSSPPPRPFLYFEYPEKGGQLAIRMGSWKGVKADMKKNRAAHWELYDLTRDPSESTDVAAAHPELLRELDATVAREHRRAHIREWEFVDSRLPP